MSITSLTSPTRTVSDSRRSLGRPKWVMTVVYGVTPGAEVGAGSSG
jgi:hypothetical protein